MSTGAFLFLSFVTGQRNRLFWDLPAQEYFNFCKVVYEIPKDVYQGKIAFDSGIRNLNRLDGLKKEIRVVFKGPWSVDLIERLGKIREMNGQEVLIEVEPDQAASVASHLFAHFSVQDISITDPPLEKIIESIYLRKMENREIYLQTDQLNKT